MVYTVGEMAKLLGVAPSTLRYYDQEGLLPFVERSSNGIRVFQDADYEWLQVIECLKKTGMPLKDIREFIRMAMQGDETIDERLELIVRQREAVRKQMEELQQTLETLDFKQWYYETARDAGTTAVPRNMTLEELPQQYREVRRRLRRE
ncbi:MAG: MerR family transcriptional regulator [Oscillospiraceae bacterium]|nr:MerR family transcriptional regulator [Oscillospiraceae bacterium]